ncbi:MAG: histidinol-phosphate transaminase [Proteobacteria bacterium]|nr:MAG: histidinol-phosphate transaminase [Pseudomonadota bacterium]
MIEACELIPSSIRSIAPYQPGKPISELAREMNLNEAEIIKLASNENPVGASPAALAAIESTLADLARYPDGNGFDLKQALAMRYHVGAEQIVLGNGSNDVLELVARCFLHAGTSAVMSQHAFIVYHLATQVSGATRIETPAKDFGHDLDAMAAAVREDTRVVWIANPNNPTGTFVGANELERFLQRIPQRVLVVMDEAYNEYLPEAVQADTVRWLARFPNLLITRTFSKAYGLAGLRVGFGLAHPEVIDLMNRVRQPFNVNSLSQVAAIAALGDLEFVRKAVALNHRGMRQLIDGLKRFGLDAIPSFGNFLSFRAGNAGRVYQRLLQQGVIVRPIGIYGLPEHLRVTVGLEAENDRFLSAVQVALHA